MCSGVAEQVGSAVQENLDGEGGEMVGGMLKEGLEAGLKAAEGASMEDGAYQEIEDGMFF